MTNYNQLNASQRETIQILFNKGKSFTDIGLAIGKDRRTFIVSLRVMQGATSAVFRPLSYRCVALLTR